MFCASQTRQCRRLTKCVEHTDYHEVRRLRAADISETGGYTLIVGVVRLARNVALADSRKWVSRCNLASSYTVLLVILRLFYRTYSRFDRSVLTSTCYPWRISSCVRRLRVAVDEWLGKRVVEIDSRVKQPVGAKSMTGGTDKLIKKAMNRQKAGDPKAAESIYKKILRDNEQHLDAAYLLGALYAEQGNITAALKYSLQADAIPPASYRVKNNLGNLYRLQEDFATAIAYFQAALRLNPEFAEAYNNLGITYHHCNQLDDAIATYRLAVALHPGFLAALFNLGNAYWDNGNLLDAAECYLRTLELDPDYRLAHDRLASYYIDKGTNETAIIHLNRCLDLDPADACGARIRLAYVSGVTPALNFPVELIQRTYLKKARHWDDDVQRKDMAFLGPRIIEQAVYAIKPALTQPLDILDLGCGTGLCGPFLRPLCGTLTGVDISAAMLAQAKPKQIYDQLVCQDITAFLLDHPPSYDLVVASGVLIFYAALDPVFRAIANSLRPGGYLVFTVYKSDSQDYSIRSNFHFAHHPDYLRHTAEFCGLKVIDLREVIHEYDKGAAQPGFVVTLWSA